MTNSKTVILWGPDDLLAQAMESFLRAEDRWEVTRISTTQGIDWLVAQAEKIKPDVIILYTETCSEDMSLPMQLIRDQPKVRVITFSLEDNRMQVYNKQNIVLHKVSDLLSLIEDRNSSENPIEKEVVQTKKTDLGHTTLVAHNNLKRP